jgi:hypothetical protein
MRRGNISFLSVIAVMVGAMVALGAHPASAATSYHFQNQVTHECLDSNASGSAYTNSCGSGNNFQRWYVSPGNWGTLIKDVATGRCLDSNAGGSAYTNPCSSGNAYQNWTAGNYSGGTGQYRSVATGLCLRVANQTVYTQTCSNTMYQTWTRS